MNKTSIENLEKGLFMTIHKSYIKAKHLVTDMVFLRHAQSIYNVESQRYLKQNNIHDLTWDEVCEIKDFNLDINYNKRFIDSDLSDHGTIQCYKLRDQLSEKHLDYDLILVSPLLRALRTCSHVFEGHPIKKIVIPELTEVMRYSCDVSKDIEEKRQEFKEMDFGRFMKEDNFWFLDTQPKETAQKIITAMADKKITEYPQAQQQLVMMMYQGKIFQNDYHLRLRTQKVKRIIEQYKKSFNKIVVISHHYMIQNLLAQGYRKNNQPISSIVDEVPNAVPIETSVERLLTVM